MDEHNARLEEPNAREIVSVYELIVDCCDSIQTKYFVNDVTMCLEKDLISALF